MRGQFLADLYTFINLILKEAFRVIYLVSQTQFGITPTNELSLLPAELCTHILSEFLMSREYRRLTSFRFPYSASMVCRLLFPFPLNRPQHSGIYVISFAFAFHLVLKQRSRGFEWNLVLLGTLFICVTAFLALNALMNICKAFLSRSLIAKAGLELLPAGCRPYVPRGGPASRAISYPQYTVMVLCQ